MKRDVDFYMSCGFRAITSFGCYLGKDYQELYGDVSLQAYGRILTPIKFGNCVTFGHAVFVSTSILVVHTIVQYDHQSQQ